MPLFISCVQRKGKNISISVQSKAWLQRASEQAVPSGSLPPPSISTTSISLPSRWVLSTMWASTLFLAQSQAIVHILDITPLYFSKCKCLSNQTPPAHHHTSCSKWSSLPTMKGFCGEKTAKYKSGSLESLPQTTFAF